jgi:hypothetical protein
VSIKSIREAIASKLSGVQGLSYVPSILPIAVPNVKLPVSTVFFAGFEQDFSSTGGLTTNVWRFRIDIYIAATHQEKAIEALESIVVDVLAAFRHDPNLGGSVEFVHVTDGGDPEYLVDTDKQSVPLLFKSLNVLVTTEES